MTNMERERAGFEAYLNVKYPPAAQMGGDAMTGKDESGNYIYSQSEWESWLACAATKEATQQELRGRLKVAVDLLREAVGPLEVSAATVESEDGNAAIEDFISNVKRCVEQFDRAALNTTNTTTGV